MFIVGCDPGTVYSEADMTAGKVPSKGTRAAVPSSSGTKEYILCQVISGNVTNGMVVGINASNQIAITSAGSPAPGDRQQLAVAIATATASASAYIWCQVQGICNVLASTSCSASVLLGLGGVAGYLDDTVSSLSAVVEGIWLTATAGAGGLTAAILNYPRYGSTH